jgi:hypothetical protein
MKALAIGLGLAALLSTASAFGVTIGQSDTFQSGLDNWQGGAGGFAVVPNGGPAGAGDQYLQISSGSSPLPPRLTAINDSQWLGNFTAAGVTAVAMDLLNSGSTSLPLRIAIREAAGGSATAGYASTTPFNLPSDALWHHVVFNLNAASLSGFNSPQPLAVDLANVKDFRILASSAPSGVGDMAAAVVGADNVTAVPEPSALVLIVAGAAFAIAHTGRSSHNGRQVGSRGNSASAISRADCVEAVSRPCSAASRPEQ